MAEEREGKEERTAQRKWRFAVLSVPVGIITAILCQQSSRQLCWQKPSAVVVLFSIRASLFFAPSHFLAVAVQPLSSRFLLAAEPAAAAAAVAASGAPAPAIRCVPDSLALVLSFLNTPDFFAAIRVSQRWRVARVTLTA
jgi:hypothetical protein